VRIARALAQLLVRVAIAVVFALVLAVVVAVIRGGDFHVAFFVGLLVVGVLCLLLAPAGQQRSYRVVETSGRIPNMPAWLQTPPGETSVSAGALFAVTGIVLIVIASVIGR
jgi:hypothetical protein